MCFMRSELKFKCNRKLDNNWKIQISKTVTNDESRAVNCTRENNF